MAEREDTISSIVEVIKDYRIGEIKAPDTEHVEKWVDQFPHDKQLPILKEISHVFKKTYISKDFFKSFLTELQGNPELAGDNPCKFWQEANFLDIQGGGASQSEIIELFDEVLKETCGFSVEDCGQNNDTFIYLDDAIFTGHRVSRDLIDWIKDEAPPNADVHVVTIADHRGSYYWCGKINDAIEESKKKIQLHRWAAVFFEDRKRYINESDVLRPTKEPDTEEVASYIATLGYKTVLRDKGCKGELDIFSGEEGRHTLEQELLIAGVKIRNECPHLPENLRPLGSMSLKAIGFGSMLITYRNCPNNTPLALWAGDPWYPLLPRKTNTDSKLEKAFKNISWT